MDILLTWVGSRDPGWDNPRTGKREPGPILSLLQARRRDACDFDTLYLLCNLDRRGEYAQRAAKVIRYCAKHFPALKVQQYPVEVVSVIDYRELFRVTNDACQRIVEGEGTNERDYFVYLSPGTPQMQTVWVLLVQSGLLNARMIDATPPDLAAPGMPIWREVDLTLEDFPQVVNPGETARLVGILQAQRDNLAAENQRLQAELDVARHGKAVNLAGGISPDFHLREYLMAQERLHYVHALQQTDGKAADAARLLGIDPAAFRARAQTLGVRQRRHISEVDAGDSGHEVDASDAGETSS